MVQGRGINAPLNEQGKKQAELVCHQLRDIHFDRFISSSLLRTHQTLDPFESEFTQLDGFDEISWGEYEGVKTTKESRTIYADTINQWRNGNLTMNVGGGESPLQVMERQKESFRELIEKDHEKILVCMHGRAMRVLLCWVLGYPLNYMDGFPHENCSYYSLIYRSGSFYVKDFNETSHLNG